MEVVQLSDPDEFLERAARLLLADEARHNLILGLAGTLRDQPARYPEFRLWVVEDAGRVVAAALKTPPIDSFWRSPRPRQRCRRSQMSSTTCPEWSAARPRHASSRTLGRRRPAR